MTLTTDTSVSQAPRLGAKPADTLLPVLRVIPPECYERSNRKALLLVARAALIWLAVLAGLVFARSWYLVIPLWMVSGLAVSGLFVLGHDCAHGALFESKELNRTIGRALMVPSLHIYESWVIGHNRIHHGHTLRQGMDFVWHPLTVEQFRALGTFAKLRQRLEWSAVGAGLYYMRSVWWNKMIRFTPPQRYRDAVRSDRRFLLVNAAVGVALTAGLTLLAGGGPISALWMVTKLLVVPFVAFCTVIGSIVYVHHIAPDIKWWPRRTWNSYHGQVEGTTVLRMPRFINELFFYNIMVHVPHHVDVRIPCYNLPQAGAAIIEAFPEIDHRSFRVTDFVRSTRACKLYDFESQTWLRYDGLALHAART